MEYFPIFPPRNPPKTIMESTLQPFITSPNNRRMLIHWRYYYSSWLHNKPFFLVKTVHIELVCVAEAAHLPTEHNHLLLITDSAVTIPFPWIAFFVLWAELLPFHRLVAVVQSHTTKVIEDAGVDIVAAIYVEASVNRWHTSGHVARRNGNCASVCSFPEPLPHAKGATPQASYMARLLSKSLSSASSK